MEKTSFATENKIVVCQVLCVYLFVWFSSDFWDPKEIFNPLKNLGTSSFYNPLLLGWCASLFELSRSCVKREKKGQETHTYFMLPALRH